MSDSSLVIVESPTKARTISKFLGKKFQVKASNGHIRDLPNNASEIPAKYKSESWSRLGIDTENDFFPIYVIPKSKREHVKALREALKGASILYLATDEDREGESISWHLVQALKPKIEIKRLVFHEITKEAIKAALESPREIDENLVRAQETRRKVDRLFGYSVSPLLWKKMAPRLSAGRVQSVAVRLLVEREKERIAFHVASFWGIKAEFEKEKGVFEAELTHFNEKRVAIGKDFDPNTGKLIKAGSVLALDKSLAEEVKEVITASTPVVTSVEERPFTSKPAPPFVTSTLQQEANRKLRFSARHTMSVAQQLYENGFITYMRTDSTTLSEQALNAARNFIESDYGSEYLPESPRIYTTKVRNAQEAHEAIRPAGENFTTLEEVKAKLGNEAFRLYELIWKRTVASQMKDAKGRHVAVHIAAGTAKLRASGKTISFPGFLRAYVEGSDDPEAELADKEKFLPKLSEGDELQTKSVNALERNTQPPARYTEGSLIKELERLGIGRPSTWATIVELVLSRSYAFKRGNSLVPTFVAMAVVGLLKGHFERLLDYEFTANLEDELDAIARGEADSLGYLHKFYFGEKHKGLKDLVKQGEEVIDPRIVCGLEIGKTEDDRTIEVRIGKYGPFITDGEQRSSIPEGMSPDELNLETAAEILEKASEGPEQLGIDEDSGLPVYLKVGPYGPYVQMGDQEEGSKKKPKMASLLKNTDPKTVDLKHALQLLSLPREVGEHPDGGKILAANGRFGPYIKWGDETRSINLEDLSPLTITVNEAVELLKQPKRQSRRSKPVNLRELGKHPITELEVVVKSGRYGPYVTDGELNASLPKDKDPQTVTMEEAVDLLAEQQRKGGGKKKTTRKKTSATKTKKTKATEKKSTNKSTKKK